MVVALTPVIAASQLPARAIYEAQLPDRAHASQVKTVEIAVDAADDGLQWYRLKCSKINSESFCIWLLCDANPFNPDAKKNTEFVRYILQEGNQTPVEYVRKRSSRALLPIWDFAGELLPRALGEDKGILFAKGKFLGHPLIRQKILPPARIEPPKDITRLVLNDELIIGTGRNFRDDGKGRKSRKDNYRYVPFTQADYDKMIAAGINYFTAAPDQVEWIRRRPVFYDARSKGVSFPEELYRSNFLGHSMFIDEPACRLAGKYPPNAHTSVAVKMIRDYIGNKQNKDYYRFGLIKAGIDLGDMKLIEPVPIWETYVGTSYYQLAANPYGFVQECRWKIDPAHDTEQLCMLQRLNEDYDADIPVTPRNLFLWFYSQMTGSARIFNSRWGMSIYGQAHPELRLPSMKLAHDMGASFIWFWTSDHDHHLPWTEQLALTEAIREYEKENPRPPLKQLLRKAKTAIVLPYGYTLPSIWQLHMWGTHLYATDRKNDLGLAYKEVLKPAIKEIGRCLRNGIPYDVIPAGAEFDPTAYDEVIRITEDARIHIEKKRIDIMSRKRVIMVPMRDGPATLPGVDFAAIFCNTGDNEETAVSGMVGLAPPRCRSRR